jgi:rhamnosyltransferase
MLKSVLAVVVSFNDGVALIKTVNALVGQVGKVVIVDNASGPETRSCIQKLEATLGIAPVYLHDNMGIGVALNIGVSIARNEHFDWILTMDQDSIAAPHMVSEMLMSAEKFQDAAVICPSLAADGIEKGNKDKVVTSAIL